MNALLIGLLVITLLVGAILLYRDYYVKRKFRKLMLAKYKLFKPLIQNLASGMLIGEADIFVMAEDPSLRCSVYRILEAYGRTDLFPAEYYTRERGAESFMVNWLEFPTELGMAPSVIDLFSKVTLEENDSLEYYVFKYRVELPHWAAKYHWMLGVCGPYTNESHPYDVPRRVFSRFNAVRSISPKAEAQWVHDHIGQ